MYGFDRGNAVGKSSVIQAILLSNYVINNQNFSVPLKDVLHMSAGGVRRLIAQRAKKLADMDLGVVVDGSTVKMSVDRENPSVSHFTVDNPVAMEPIVYLSAERVGPRLSYMAEGETIFEAHGNNAAYIMEQTDMKKLAVPEELIVDERTTKFSYQVE